MCIDSGRPKKGRGLVKWRRQCFALLAAFCITCNPIRERPALEMKLEGQDIVLRAIQGKEVGLLSFAFFAVVIAPLYEERIFRSWVYGGLRRWMGPVGSTILSAAAFSLYHLEPVAFPVTFALGLAAGFLRERTGGLHAPIALHACYNAVQVLGVVSARGG